MPIVYLSPSTQEYEYVTGGTEEYYMNLIVDAMVPYLRANNIGFTRNNPGDSIEESINQANQQIYDLYLSLDSGYSPERVDPILQGLNVYHYAYSPVGGERAAYYIANNLREIYPYPSLVRIISTEARELRDPNFPAVSVELGYRGNPEDELWMKQNIDLIAIGLVRSIAEFLDQPFVDISNSLS